MDEFKRRRKGSESRDRFKQQHKELDKYYEGLHATDIDFCLVSKYPPGIVAFLDFKLWSDEGVTFAEVLAYNKLTKIAPVYIIEGGPKCLDSSLIIREYVAGNYRPFPPIVTWGDTTVSISGRQEYSEWEKSLRESYSEEHRSSFSWAGEILDNSQDKKSD